MSLNKILFFVFLLFSFAAAQNYKQVKIYLSGQDDIKKLIEQGISIDHYSTEKDNSIIVFLSDSEFSIFSLGFRDDVLIDNWFEYYNNLRSL